MVQLEIMWVQKEEPENEAIIYILKLHIQIEIFHNILKVQTMYNNI